MILDSGKIGICLTPFPSLDKRWMWWKSINTLITDLNGDATVKERQEWTEQIVFLRKLKFFCVCIKVLHIFYQSEVES